MTVRDIWEGRSKKDFNPESMLYKLQRRKEMNKQIVIINGSGGVGKDTFVHLCGEYTFICNYSSVDKIKMAARMLGWHGIKSERDRKFLSDLKMLASEHYDSSYKYIGECIDKFLKNDMVNVMFIHIREPEEIDRIKNDFGCHTLLIVNSNIPQITSNIADLNVSKYKYDFIIDNRGTVDDLQAEAKKFIEHILEEK